MRPWHPPLVFTPHPWKGLLVLKLRIDPTVLGTSWAWNPGRGRMESGASWIQPLDHPAVDCTAITDQDSGATSIWVREVLPGHNFRRRRVQRHLRTTGYLHARTSAQTWPLDFVGVEIKPDRTVHLTTGERGTAPVYLSAAAGVLHGSWNMADVVQHVRRITYDVPETARLLALWFRYSRHTCFGDVHRLTERATAIFDGRPLSIAMPEPASHSHPRTLADDADVLGAYRRMLDGVLARHAIDPATTCAHVSGGVDSAVTGTHIAMHYPEQITASAMLLPGASGHQQRARRAEMIHRAGFSDDITVEADCRPPLHPAGARARGLFVNPYEEPYHEATSDLVNAMSAQGIRTVVTGIGGDEMVALTPSEAPREAVGPGHTATPWLGREARNALADAEWDMAPPTVVNEMTLLAVASAAPLLLDAGIWPLHPFADPHMIRFGEWLPYQWRAHKVLHRRRLAALGMPPHVVHPAMPENFTPVMHQAVTSTIADQLARLLAEGSPLIESELVDPDTLTLALNRIRDGEVHDTDDRLADVIAADLAFRAANSPSPLEKTCT